MDPRQNLNRTTSSNVPPGPYNPNMASAYQMPYQQHPHLPPIQSYHQQLPPANQNYMPQQQQPQPQPQPQQQYRPELSRYQSAPAPAPAPDRYNPHVAPQPQLGGAPPASMLPHPNSGNQPQSQQYPPPPTSGGQPYQQRLAPAPPRPNNLAPLGTQYPQVEDNRGPPQMWDPNIHPQQGLPADNGRDPTRTHVVGSQGRRGILPSAPGRAAVMPNAVNGSPKTNNAVPAKDADGKFPCPNCNKTYLHAKHLKRHMLRHTGDRPYMCVLCNDTFSRSDILKRHFQKCSVRRGNPTGASHLSNPAAHLKKSQAAAAKSTATDSPNSTTTPTTAGLTNGAFTSSTMSAGPMTSTSSSNYTDAPQMPYGMPNAPSNDMQRPQPGQVAPHNGEPNPNQSWAMQNPRTNQMMYHSTPASPNQFAMTHGNVDDKRHGMPGAGQHMAGEDWNMFHAANQENYMNPMFSGYDQGHHDVKNEHPEGAANGSYYISSTSLGADGTLRPPLWHLDKSSKDLLQLKADQLIDFSFPCGLQESLEQQQNNFHVRACLTPSSIKTYLESFNKFQGHWPFLHLPTFSIASNTYDGILPVIICIGAVYSDHVTKSQVRDLMVRTKQGIERTSSILKNMGSGKKTSASGVDFAEFQALLWVQTSFVWNGGPVDRAKAREDNQRIFQLARRYGLLTLSDPGNTLSYSYLHSLTAGQKADASKFMWHTWAEQEKHVRTMYMCYLVSVALNIYFNVPAAFDPAEIRLPLPCDDAAWDAQSEEACAQVLGLRGLVMQRTQNMAGSLRTNQTTLADAMYILHDATIPLQPRFTNVYSKFILIHALHTEIWRLQKQRSCEISLSQTPGIHPTNPQTAIFRSLTTATERWKASWGEDMVLQYPVIPAEPSSRFGFCRDGVHFYFLGRAFMQPSRIDDWRLPADTRFYQSLRGLSQAANWARQDVLSRGKEPGSGFDFDVGDYGAGTLELNMRKLFPPLEA